MEKPKAAPQSMELQCVGSLETVRPKPVGFLCGSIPVPTDKAFHDSDSALIPSAQTVQAPRYRTIPTETELNMLPVPSIIPDMVLPLGVAQPRINGGKSTTLLDLEVDNSNANASSIESKILFCKRDDFLKPQIAKSIKSSILDKKPNICTVSESNVLGKVKNFLEVISEANKKLQVDAKGDLEKYDIEVLNGNETKLIEMDLMLGVADLHTPEAVAAAESAMAGYQSSIFLATGDNGDDSEDDQGDDDDDSDYEDGGGSDDYKKMSKASGENSSSEALRKQQSKKRTKIIELS